MQEEVLDGIVINVQDYKDSTKLLTILSGDGKKLVNAKGINKSTSKLKAVANVFCFAEFSLLTKNKTTLVGANLYDSFFALSSNYKNYVTSCAIVDLVNKTTDDDTILKQLFLPCVNSIKDLCYGNNNPLLYLNAFLVKYLSICGYKLNTSTCSNCSKTLTEFYFNPYDASILCQDCKLPHCNKFTNEQIAFIENKQKGDTLSHESLLHITKNLANAIFCLTGIKLKIDYLL